MYDSQEILIANAANRHYPVVRAQLNVLLAHKVLHAGTLADKASSLAMLLCCMRIISQLLSNVLCASLPKS